MTMTFPSEFFAGNRRRLLEVTSAELVVISANGLLQRSADTAYPFRQDSNFWYLTGINEPDIILVISQTEEFIIYPPRAEHRDQWDGELDQQKLINASGIEDMLEHHVGWNRLDRLLKKIKKVHTITPAEAYFERLGFYANPARASLLAQLKRHRSLELIDIRKPIARLRQVKQPVEIKAIQKAIDITIGAFEMVNKRLSKYKTEYEVVADITAEFIKNGASGHAYQPIVAVGVNAATIHYIECKDKLNTGELLLLDVGAEFENYGADITRTISNGAMSKRQKAVFQAVIAVQKAAFKLLKPGVTLKDYEAKVDKIMAKHLVALGLLEDEDDKQKLKKYYPHLASHFLGLDTHDAADYDRPLEPGMVLTVEPGIYIPGENIGIRVEDDVLITEKGVTILSAGLPVGPS